jgi:hypothetical protein
MVYLHNRFRNSTCPHGREKKESTKKCIVINNNTLRLSSSQQNSNSMAEADTHQTIYRHIREAERSNSQHFDGRRKAPWQEEQSQGYPPADSGSKGIASTAYPCDKTKDQTTKGGTKEGCRREKENRGQGEMERLLWWSGGSTAVVTWRFGGSSSCCYNNNDTATTADAAIAASAVNTLSAGNNAAAAAATTNHTSTTTATGAEESNSIPTDTVQANNDSEEYDVVTIDNPAINVVVAPADATANLDYDEEEAKKKGSDDFDDDNAPGVQQQYVAAIQKQVQKEVSKDNKNINNQWLVQHLRQNDWWIRKEQYLWFIRKYNKTREKEEDKLNEEHKAYYRDVVVWLPHVRWQTADKKYMPYCPNCKSNVRVGPHCFRDNHAGRVIVGLTSTYDTVGMLWMFHYLFCRSQGKQSTSSLQRSCLKILCGLRLYSIA